MFFWWVLSIFPPTKETHFKVNNRFTRTTFFDVCLIVFIADFEQVDWLLPLRKHKQNGHFSDNYSYIFRFMISRNYFDEILANNLMRGKVASNQRFLLYASKGSHKNGVKKRTMRYYISVLRNYTVLSCKINLSCKKSSLQKSTARGVLKSSHAGVLFHEVAGLYPGFFFLLFFVPFLVLCACLRFINLFNIDLDETV